MQKEEISAAIQPYYTDNAILAFCLWRASIPFWEPKQPCIVLYNLDIIRKFVDGKGDPIFKGWDLEPAIEAAHKRGLRGHVLYVFRPTIRMKDLMEAFREQERILARDDITVESIIKTIVDSLSSGDIESDEALLRLACVDLKTRIEFMELWRKQVPMMWVNNEGEVEELDEIFIDKEGNAQQSKVFDHPGFKIRSINASKATRERLGV
jgi:hypothetical protein